ncbi:MAG: hypothetical protein ACREMW_12235 [Gemmatimonadales bacterium]
MRFPRFLPLLALAGAGSTLAAQASAGTELWRLAAVTLPMPVVLATGAAAAFWNPAQRAVEVGRLGVDLVQTPQAVGATGVIAALQFPLRRVGTVGFLYARMGVGDLVRTTDSPDPSGESIPFFSQSGALTWARDVGHTTVGARVTYHDTRFDGVRLNRWTLDAGLDQHIGERLRLSAATRGFRRLGSDPGQDVYAGMQYRLWRGTLWRATPGMLVARYGLTFGHPGGADQQFGAGLDIGAPISLDVVLAREASYGNATWRGAAGLRVSIGRYQLSFARDGGVSDLGSAFRVGLEARLK